MNENDLLSCFRQMRSNDFSRYHSMSKELTKAVPLFTPIMVGVNTLTTEEAEKVRSILSKYNISESAIAAEQSIEDVFRVFIADYVHGAPR